MMSLFRFSLLEFEFGLTDVSRKCEKVLVAVVVEGFLIDWYCFLEGFFIYEVSDSRLLIDCGMLPIMRGGCLDYLLM